jgi:hypothetical protein
MVGYVMNQRISDKWHYLSEGLDTYLEVLILSDNHRMPFSSTIPRSVWVFGWAGYVKMSAKVERLVKNIYPLMRYLPLNSQRDFLQSGPQKMYTLFILYFTCKSVYIFLGHSVFNVCGWRFNLALAVRATVFSGCQHLWMIGGIEVCQHFCVNCTDAHVIVPSWTLAPES